MKPVELHAGHAAFTQLHFVFFHPVWDCRVVSVASSARNVKAEQLSLYRAIASRVRRRPIFFKSRPTLDYAILA
jgi:hypothetical protein